MNRSNIWRVPVCIVLTVLSVVLLVGGAEPFVLRRMLSADTLEKVIEPFNFSGIADEEGISYIALLTDRFNEELLALAEKEAGKQGYTGDVTKIYRDILTFDDVEECLDSHEFKKVIASKGGQYFKSLVNRKKESSLDTDELMQLKCVQDLLECINDKLTSLNSDVDVTISDDQMEDILANVLDYYGLRELFSSENLAETRRVLKTPAKWGYDFLIDRLFRSNPISVLMLIGGCLCLVAIGCLRYKQIARMAMYGIVALTLAAGVFCLQGQIISGLSKAVSSFDFFDWNLPVAAEAVIAFAAWCIVVLRDIFFSEALWFLAGTLPLWALEIWYYIDKKQVEHSTQAVRHNMSYEDE